MKKIFFALLGIFLLGLENNPASAETIVGQIKVIDADTFDVGNVRIRLHGINAPEKSEKCLVDETRQWACGRWAVDEALLLYEGALATCELTNQRTFDREVARCRVDGEDVAGRLVQLGLARVDQRYSLDYIDDEKAAWFAGVGIWRGKVDPPAEPKVLDLARFPRPQNKDCAIKGNISGNGMIYHLPGQQDYNKTEISELKGERWFCTEAEAIAAGWRGARR